MKTTKTFYGITLALTCGFATSLKAQNLYVGTHGNDTIGAYGMDGSTVDASLITGLDGPEGIAISGNDVFIANFTSGTIGEYTTSGTTVDASLITGLTDSVGLAISGNDLFVVNGNKGTIGEYGLDGSTVEASLISGLSAPFDIAISGNDLFVQNEAGTMSSSKGFGVCGSFTNNQLSIIYRNLSK